jgi:MoaA/NifB/PqqE/SkfB family radical SAM enzyme
MKLDQIGFYTVTEERAARVGAASRMWRGEIILTDRCNYHCAYCQGLPFKTDIPFDLANLAIDTWIADHLKYVRFSGGEPTLYHGLPALVEKCHLGGVERIGISTNGTAPINYYKELVAAGLDDICISLDAAMPDLADRMAGVRDSRWELVAGNIGELARLTYVAAAVVFTQSNAGYARETIRFLYDLGVSDIRIMTASHASMDIVAAIAGIDEEILAACPILKYRVSNFLQGRDARGIRDGDSHRCHLVRDDCVVAGEWHYPCGPYLRERGKPIGKIHAGMRAERQAWSESHDTHVDPICRAYCSDFYIDYNNRCETLAG